MCWKSSFSSNYHIWPSLIEALLSLGVCREDCVAAALEFCKMAFESGAHGNLSYIAKFMLNLVETF